MSQAGGKRGERKRSQFTKRRGKTEVDTGVPIGKEQSQISPLKLRPPLRVHRQTRGVDPISDRFQRRSYSQSKVKGFLRSLNGSLSVASWIPIGKMSRQSWINEGERLFELCARSLIPRQSRNGVSVQLSKWAENKQSKFSFWAFDMLTCLSGMQQFT